MFVEIRKYHQLFTSILGLTQNYKITFALGVAVGVRGACRRQASRSRKRLPLGEEKATAENAEFTEE